MATTAPISRPAAVKVTGCVLLFTDRMPMFCPAVAGSAESTYDGTVNCPALVLSLQTNTAALLPADEMPRM